MTVIDDSFAPIATRSAQLEDEIRAHPRRFRVLTGDRPTGALHLGHYFGTLVNRVRLQQAGVEVFVVIADYQVITDRDSVGTLSGNVRELLLDYLATGIDPRSATIFTHSAVPALNQLMLPFLSLVTVAELHRNPTVRAEAALAGTSALAHRHMRGLLLTYPVHQAADILFCRGNLVPAGKDQLPHVEITRVIARRFNTRYADGTSVFPEPEVLLSEAPVLLGIDGTKMSKSRGNAIELRATEDQTAELIRRAKTDTQRAITYDPEHRPEIASLLLTAALALGRTPDEIAEEVGNRGAAALKATVTETVNEHLRPLRERRRALAAEPGYLREVLTTGNRNANQIASSTLDQVRECMDMTY